MGAMKAIILFPDRDFKGATSKDRVCEILTNDLGATLIGANNGTRISAEVSHETAVLLKSSMDRLRKGINGWFVEDNKTVRIGPPHPLGPGFEA